MRYSLAYQPSYSLALLELDPNEEIRCESGAMVSMAAHLKLQAQMNTGGKSGGGLLGSALGALGRSVLGGESFFITTIRAESEGGEVTLAPAVPGDIMVLELERPLIVQGGSYLASASTITVDTQFAGLKGLMGGEGLFFLRVSGQGTLFLTAFGAIHQRTLREGERYVVDSGHMVAYQEGMAVTSRLAAEGGGGFLKRAVTSATTGEGMVMEFTGPGNVILQTRNPQAFSTWMQKLLPSQNSGSS